MHASSAVRKFYASLFLSQQFAIVIAQCPVSQVLFLTGSLLLFKIGDSFGNHSRAASTPSGKDRADIVLYSYSV